MAADLMQNLWGKHFEKVILAAAVAVLVVAAGFFVFTRAPKVRDRESLATDVTRIIDARKAPADKALPADLRTQLGLDKTPVSPKDYDEKLNGLPPPWETGNYVAWTDKFVEGQKVEKTIVTVKPPMTAPKVAPVVLGGVVTGRGTTNEAVAASVFKLADAKTPISDIVWVGVVGHLDLTEQVKAFKDANADPQDVIITRVEIQRREQKPDGTWTEWKSVPPAVSAPIAAKWPKTPANPRDKRLVSEWYMALKSAQADVRRMPLYHLVAEDKEGQRAEAVAGTVSGVEQAPWPKAEKPVEKAPTAEGAPPAPAPEVAPPPPSTTGGPSWLEVTGKTAPPKTGPTTGPTPAAEAGARHVTATLWAYDTTVEPGKTYQYQMRAAVFNPVYAGPTDQLKDDKVRWTLEFPGEWSRASRDITVPNLVQFFFIGTFGEKANVDLHRWILGQWVILQSYQANLGAPVAAVRRQKLEIPGTKETTKTPIDIDMNGGALLVDVVRNFMYQPPGNNQAIRTNLLVCADASGRLSYRIEWEDKTAATRARQDRIAGVAKPVAPTPTPPTPSPVRPPKKETPTPPPPKKETPTKRPATAKDTTEKKSWSWDGK